MMEFSTLIEWDPGPAGVVVEDLVVVVPVHVLRRLQGLKQEFDITMIRCNSCKKIDSAQTWKYKPVPKWTDQLNKNSTLIYLPCN